MTEDRLLKELGDLARREEEAGQALLDERWDRLAAGTLTAEEEAELRALAESSPEARDAYEAFRPLGAGFQARVAAAAGAELAPVPDEGAPRTGPQEARARLLPFRRGTSRIAAWIGSVAAVAAVLFFFVRSPTAPLPLYTAELGGGDQSLRGSEPEPSSGLPVFVPGSLLTLNVRPQKTVAGPVEARCFVSPLSGGGELRPWEPEPPLEIRNGAVRIRGTLGREIQLAPGAWRTWVVVGRPGGIPSARELAGELRSGRIGHADWQAVSAVLRVDDRASP